METPPSSRPAAPHRVVVIGGGFGGVEAVRKLRRLPVEVTLVDKRNFHLFQPLTYQVATGALSPSEVAYPLRSLLKRAPNVDVRLAEVRDFDLAERRVLLRSVEGVPAPDSIPYDTLIVAAGSSYSYFGHDEFAEYAAEVKTLESATAVRSHILRAFERADGAASSGEGRPDLTFVIVGGGPTGVEMAGQIAELARGALRGDYRHIDPGSARVLLLDVGDRILVTFPPSLSAKATRSLERLGVTVRTGHNVVDVDADGVTVVGAEGTRERIDAATVIWAAGVTASGLAKNLAERGDGDVDRSGRLLVEPDLTMPKHPEVVVLGDMVRVRSPSGGEVPLPGVAPVAIQQGRYAGRLVRDRLRGHETRPFRYRDKGNLATIGRARAVADLHVIRLSGFPAWVVWLVVHIWYLMGGRNRILVTTQWAITFFTHGRGSRLITDPPTAYAASSPENRGAAVAVGDATERGAAV